MKTITNYEEFGSSKSMISKAQNVLDQTIFKRGCCKKKKKKKTFCQIFIWDLWNVPISYKI